MLFVVLDAQIALKGVQQVLRPVGRSIVDDNHFVCGIICSILRQPEETGFSRLRFIVYVNRDANPRSSEYSRRGNCAFPPYALRENRVPQRNPVANIEMLLDRPPGVLAKFSGQIRRSEHRLQLFAQIAMVVGDITIVAVGYRR